MKKRLVGFLLLLLPTVILAQDTLTQEALFAYIKRYHPIAKQASLLREKGQRGIQQAQGNFDPYIFSDIDQKYFSGKQYFSLIDAGMKIPTWYGPDIKLGFDQNVGVFLNPENYTPTSGLLYGGISAPLAQGLVIDKRRTAVLQARVFAQATEVERLSILNNLFVEAAQAYWEWVAYSNQVAVYENAVQLAQTRYEMTKQSFRLGDRAAIDTTEAYLQVQDRLFNLNQTRLLSQNARLMLSNFLWYENDTPLELTDNIKPVSLQSLSLGGTSRSEVEKAIEQLPQTHPDLRLYDFKMKNLEIEQRWKREKLKPKFNVQYNFLSYTNKSPLYNFPTQYKWGLDFSMPIYLREARGDLAINKIKMLETNYARNQKELEITNKIRAYFNDQQNLQQQLQLFNQMIGNYSTLLKGEQVRFDLGESSLFLINAREVSLISAQIKYLDLQAKLYKTQAAIRWAQGDLANTWE